MSDPPPPPMTSPVIPKPAPRPPLSAEKPTTTTTTTTRSSDVAVAAQYRRGNWTLHETLTLIAAKKLHDRRRATNASTAAELRWKWVEDYCWEHGCSRSQSQCNDKWDNLLRDYKKVHQYQQQQQQEAHSSSSYWEMERQQRKERDLPSNLPHQVYEALNEVVVPVPTHHRNKDIPTTTTKKICCHSQLAPTTTATAAEAAAPPPTTVHPPPPPLPDFSVESSDSSETNERGGGLGSETKRRKKVRDLGSSIVRSAGILARALLASEERRERRHRDLMDLEERILRIEEARVELNRQAMSGLVSAVNNLSNAILALASNRHNNAT